MEFLIGGDTQKVVEVVTLAGFVTSQVVALFGTPKWLPDVAVKAINFLAGNYRKAKNIE